jgi:hypothetical protein
MSGWQRRVVFVFVLLGVLAQLTLSGYLVTLNSATDFGKLYFGWHQADLYSRSPASLDVWRGHVGHWYRNLNPPHVFLLAGPFSRFPLHSAWVCWFLLQLASIAWLVRFTIRRGSGSG